MPAVVELPCPSCEKSLKVPDTVFGKKIKCKHCGHAFVVEDPEEAAPKKSAAKPSKPGGAAVKAKPKEEPKPQAPPKRPFDDDEDDDGAAPKPISVVEEEYEVPRCPHCAKELDPPDAVVCVHCGFNNVTRVKADSKKVWAPDAADWMSHLAPGIFALLIAIGLIVLNVLCILNMRDWLTGSFLESDEKDAAGRVKFYIAPGAFIFGILGLTVLPFIALARFAIKRLAIDYRPTEQMKK
jgi:hypothetical protein